MGAFTQFDGNLLIGIQHALIRDWLTPIVTFITHLGNHGIICFVMILLMLFFRKSRHAGIISIYALILSYVFNNILLKNLIHRTRPYDMFPEVQLLIERQSDFSFPSGHAANTMCVGFMMLLMLPRKYGVPAFILMILISLSRLYVGVHYPSDVLVGAVSGMLCAYIVYRFFRRDRHSPLLDNLDTPVEKEEAFEEKEF